MTLRPNLLMVCLLVVASTLDAQTVRVSHMPGVQGNEGSYTPSINDAGDLVAFTSDATNFSAGDTNNASDIFLRNMNNGALARVSVSPNTALANGPSFLPVLLGDGASLIYSSDATNLVAGDTNARTDVFRRGLQGATQRLSLTSAGGQLSDFSFTRSPSGGNASYALFDSFAAELPGAVAGRSFAYLRNIGEQTTIRLSFAPGGGPPRSSVSGLAVSADGTLILLASEAELVPGVNALNRRQLYLRDRVTQTTTLITRTAAGGYANHSMYPGGSMSSDGRYIAFATTNFDGSLQAIGSCSDSSKCIHVYDRSDGSLRVVGPADQLTTEVEISDDGEWIAAIANRLAPFFPGGGIGDYQAFAVHRATGAAQLLSRSSAGALGNAGSSSPSISADGRFVAYSSAASNLLAPGADSNGFRDVFRTVVDQSGIGPADLIFRHGFQKGG